MTRCIRQLLVSYAYLLEELDNSDKWRARCLEFNLEAAVLGAKFYSEIEGFSNATKLESPEFVGAMIDRMCDLLEGGEGISYQDMCFCAAPILGDFNKHARALGDDFGFVAKKIGLDISIFTKYKVEPEEARRLCWQFYYKYSG